MTNHRPYEHEAGAPGGDLALAEDIEAITEQPVSISALQPAIGAEILSCQK